MIRTLVLTILLLAAPMPTRAQQNPSADSRPWTLPDLVAFAVATDPRTKQIDLLERQTSLRLRNISAQWWPQLSVESQAQFQSEAAVAPLLNSAGAPLFAAPKSTYDTYLRADQRLFDPSLAAQRELERAEKDERQARVNSALFAVRDDVNSAFFAAAALERREQVVEASLSQLDAQLRETEARVREGAAVLAEAQIVQALLLQRRQETDDLRANRGAAMRRLSTLTGQSVDESRPLKVPDLSAAVALARQTPTARRDRPEFVEFQRTRARLDRQIDFVSAQAKPKLSAFARAGSGKPGLNFISSEFDAYALGGVRLQWNFWTWGATGREGDALLLQREIAQADEAAFARSLAVSLESQLPVIDRLERTLAGDAQIIELREQVERSARARMAEGVLTAADYLARNTELVQARAAMAGHQVELAEAQARFLTTLGLEVK